MNPYILAIITSLSIISILEVFKSFDKKLISALTLVAIAFIYTGFAWEEISTLIMVIAGNLVFISLAYFGYKRNYLWIIIGLVLHGLWDLIYPFFSTSAPQGYDIFCILVDFILAVYFFVKLKAEN